MKTCAFICWPSTIPTQHSCPPCQLFLRRMFKFRAGHGEDRETGANRANHVPWIGDASKILHCLKWELAGEGERTETGRPASQQQRRSHPFFACIVLFLYSLCSSFLLLCRLCRFCLIVPIFLCHTPSTPQQAGGWTNESAMFTEHVVPLCRHGQHEPSLLFLSLAIYGLIARYPMLGRSVVSFGWCLVIFPDKNTQ